MLGSKLNHVSKKGHRAGVKYVFVFANTNTNTAVVDLYLIVFHTAYLYLITVFGEQWNPSGKARNVWLKLRNLVHFRAPFFMNHLYFTPHDRPPLLKGHPPSWVAFIEGFHCIWRLLSAYITILINRLIRTNLYQNKGIRSTLPIHTFYCFNFIFNTISIFIFIKFVMIWYVNINVIDTIVHVVMINKYTHMTPLWAHSIGSLDWSQGVQLDLVDDLSFFQYKSTFCNLSLVLRKRWRDMRK